MDISQIANTATADIAGLDNDLAIQWVKRRYIELAGIGPLKPFRRLYEVTVPALINTGGITTTRGSKTVTPNAAAIAVLSNSIVGRFLRGSSNWYEVAAYDGATITLISPWAEAALAEGTFQIAARRITLEKGVRWTGTFVNMFTGISLERGSLDWLDMASPQRTSIGGTPRWYAELGTSDDDLREVEFYPYDTNDALIRYTGYAVPDFDSLNPETKIPVQIDPHILIEGCLVDAMRRKMAIEAEKGNADIAALWRNDYRAQETRWEKRKREFENASSAGDDTTFILASRSINPIDHDLRTGREAKLAQWSSLSLQ